MNIDKQVEEIRVISKEIQKTGLGEHLCDAIAVGVFDAGYRKANEVALEVIEEASEIARRSADEAKLLADSENDVLQKTELRGEQIGALLVLKGISELKKKYTEEVK